MVYIKSTAVWIIFVFLAIANGIIREKAILPKLGDYPGHVASTVIMTVVIFIITCLFVKYLKTTGMMVLLLIGIYWTILTVIFEFIFGHYFIGDPWSKLLADYNIIKGRLWCFVLLSTLFAPVICGKFFNSLLTHQPIIEG